MAVWAGAAAGGAMAARDDIKWYADRERAWKYHQSAWDRQKVAMQKAIQWAAQDAREAGLHPLAALGVSSAAGPPIAPVGGVRGGAGGAALVQALSRMGAQRASKKQDALEMESRRLDVEAKHLRNDRMLMDNMGQATLGPGGHSNLSRGAVPGQEVDVQPDVTTAGSGGLTAAKDRPAEMWADVPNPRWGYVKIPTLTQQLTESLEDNLMFKIPYYATKIDTYFQGFAQKYGRDANAKIKWMSFWKRHLPQPDPGKEWTYNVAGFFHQQKAGTLARQAAMMRDTRRQDRLVDEHIIP